ncbi:hypothetical protein G6F43_008980 [Rhizopus delemar]|nr:hypothetical protein G6F43_008980 [Rhizopus delemar]
MFIVLPLIVLFAPSVIGYSDTSKTIYETLHTLSLPLYENLSDKLRDLLSSSKSNQTLFLPNITALNQSIASGMLNFSIPSTQTFFLLDGLYTLSTPQTVQTIQNYTLYIQPTGNNTAKLSSGITQAQLTGKVQCQNGLIYLTDNFLAPAQSPLDTISNLEETQRMEELLKSLNLSDIISGQNKTILAPNNQALTNQSDMPFGTILHVIKYLVLDGIFMSDMLTENTIQTEYGPLMFSKNESLYVRNKYDRARLIKTDLLTTTGVIHVIDRVLAANESTLSVPASVSSIVASVTSSTSLSVTLPRFILFYSLLLLFIVHS